MCVCVRERVCVCVCVREHVCVCEAVCLLFNKKNTANICVGVFTEKQRGILSMVLRAGPGGFPIC